MHIHSSFWDGKGKTLGIHRCVIDTPTHKVVLDLFTFMKKHVNRISTDGMNKFVITYDFRG